MKKVFSVFLVSCFIVSCSNRVFYSSSWPTKHITIDGNIPEWSNPLRFYDQETGISYCISNDRYNLYLACSISNELMQAKILRSGLEFGIDTLGKKSFAVGIRYPVGNISETAPGPGVNPISKSDTRIKPDRSALKLKLLAEAREIQLTGFKPRLGKFISLSSPDNSGISAAINFNAQGIMNYEAVIPFSTFYKKELTPSDSNTVFNYRIKVNPVPDLNNRANRSGGMHGGGMRGGMGGSGMRSGGMRGGGMRGGGMNGRSMSGEDRGNDYQRNADVSGTTKTTIKLKLAYR